MGSTYPPKFALYQRQTQGAGTHTLTEFNVCAKFRLSSFAASGFGDGARMNGNHDVKIELTAK